MYKPYTADFEMIELALCETLSEVVRELRDVDFSTYVLISAKNDLKAANEIARSAAEIYLVPGILAVYDFWIAPDSWSDRSCVHMMLAVECASNIVHASLSLMKEEAEISIVFLENSFIKLEYNEYIESLDKLIRQIKCLRVMKETSRRS